ncbi:MAG: helix-turn-helix domain-containing protein [Moritella sp.]|uniref:helix-turn-helix domain-containing protein n=1 Tax=Moritella sp. TaxID=78556 RepID=UPI0029B3A5B8|nr:helix-turn-helix domain-containing protein [Moritella sp.]MDX2320880.1 helix-turn-helix domain-containing protein [Moritella sp.]
MIILHSCIKGIILLKILTAKLNQPIALIKTGQVKKFVEMLQMVEKDIYPIIERVGLPEKVLNTAHPYIPEIPVRLLLAEIFNVCGIKTYQEVCWRACRELFIPSMLDKVSDAQNLQQLLIEYINILKNESTQFKLSLENAVNKTWLVREKAFADDAWYLYAELFSMAYMIELIRAVTKDKWSPAQISIQSNEPELFKQLLWADNNQGALPQIFSERGVCAICIPDELLSVTFKHQHTWVKPVKDKDAPSDFIGSLTIALPAYLNEGKLPISKAARMTGMSVRTFQRRLDTFGLNYTQILKKIQLQEAQYYLAHTDVTITIIAVGLGYSDTAHFSRAFKRLSGVTPSQYRYQCKNNAMSSNGN